MKFKTKQNSALILCLPARCYRQHSGLRRHGRYRTASIIHIDSDQQSLICEGNVVTFTGNVVMTRAARLRSTPIKSWLPAPAANRGKRRSTVTQLATFSPDAGQRCKPAERPRFPYALRAGERFCGAESATLIWSSLTANIAGDKITYPVKEEQKMQAFSEKGKRVTTVLVPPQLQDKNKGQTPAQKKSN